VTSSSDVTLRDRLHAVAERRLSSTEIDAYLRTPVSEAERETVLEQVRWFLRRHPAGADRLAYVRRACRRWTQPTGPARP
jgi:hypothetical protein